MLATTSRSEKQPATSFLDTTSRQVPNFRPWVGGINGQHNMPKQFLCWSLRHWVWATLGVGPSGHNSYFLEPHHGPLWGTSQPSPVLIPVWYEMRLWTGQCLTLVILRLSSWSKCMACISWSTVLHGDFIKNCFVSKHNHTPRCSYKISAVGLS